MTTRILNDATRDTLREWFRDARKAGWDDLAGITRAAVRVHGEVAGLWRCDHCHGVTLDVAVSSECGCSEESEAVLLYGDIILCHDCYEAAQAARKKIAVINDEEAGLIDDRSDLDDEEQKLASYLDRAEEAINRFDRELIRDYPRDERWQLHRYQDDIEADRFRSGKRAE